VLDPAITGYTLAFGSYRIGQAIVANTPTLFGPAPGVFTVSPALPDGLILDSLTGTITGTPTTLSTAANYVITADYPSSPDATFTLSIRVKSAPTFAGTDNPPMVNYVSLGEWEAGLDNWVPTNATATASGGFLNVNTTAIDPQLFRAGLTVNPAVAGTLLEIRLRQTEGSVLEVFWADGSGGIAAIRRLDVPAANVIADGQFHTYQVSFDGAFEGNLAQLRLDPGATPGRAVEIDYIRLGFAAPPAPLEISNFVYDPVFREATITWNSASGRLYTLQTSTTMDTPASWGNVSTNITGDPGTTSYIDRGIPAGTTRRFYRVVPQ
jgi:Putative Ig domain